jgi:cation:H+ antiporter
MQKTSQVTDCLDIKKDKGLKLEYRLGIFGLCIISFWLLVRDSELGSNTFINIFVVIGSLALLTGASDIILEFSVKLSELFNVSELVIGLTIVSIGTSIPEIFTAIISCIRGVGSLVIGDIYGSYITQLTIFMGLVILAAPVTVNKKIRSIC